MQNWVQVPVVDAVLVGVGEAGAAVVAVLAPVTASRSAGSRGRSSRGRRGVVDPAVVDLRCASSRRCRSRPRALAQPVGDRRRVEGAGVGRDGLRARRGPRARAGGRGREDDRRDAAIRGGRGGDTARSRAAASPGRSATTATVLKSAAAVNWAPGLALAATKVALRAADRPTGQQDRQQQPHQGAGPAGGCAAVSGHRQRNRARARDSFCYRPIRGLLRSGWTDVRRAGVAASAAKRANARQTVREVPVNTRTIAIIALIIAVIVLILLLM